MKNLIMFFSDFLMYFLIGGSITAIGIFLLSFFYKDIFVASDSFGTMLSVWVLMWFGQFFGFLYLFYKKRNMHHIFVVLIPVVLIPIIFNLDSVFRIIWIFFHILSSLIFVYLIVRFRKNT